jgi:transcriptional regulator with GAF, ATPase, and Fis domain
MSRREPDSDETRSDSDSGSLPPMAVPVLIIVGDAATLGTSRAVRRIKGSLEIGRRPDASGAQAWAVDDDRASRRHAIIRLNARRGIAEIADLGSRNGTLLNGLPLGPEPTPLPPGAMLFIGSHAAVFRFVSEQDLQHIEQELASPLTPVATTSPDLARRCFVLRQLARGSEDLLIVGETGVGKEQFARAIHQASGRPGKFVAINCPALPGTLIESELFGYIKGAHSQAARDKPGLIDEADGGTLFLDEFAEIGQEVQAKLLRFLEEKEFQPLGSTRTRKANVRVLAATNRELGALRQDITARLGPEPIRLPPLREHPEDIAALAGHFLRDRPGLGLDVPAFQALCLADWPDNVRGLRKALTRAADLAVAQVSPAITLAHLPDSLRTPAPARGAPVTSGTDWTPGNGLPMNAAGSPTGPSSASPARRSPRAAPSKAELEALLSRNDWVVSRAAREIDRDHAVVWRWIKRYGLDVDRARD